MTYTTTANDDSTITVDNGADGTPLTAANILKRIGYAKTIKLGDGIPGGVKLDTLIVRKRSGRLGDGQEAAQLAPKTINGVRLPDTSISYVSTLPLGKTLGTYSASATITLQRDGDAELGSLLDRLPGGRWNHLPTRLHPLFIAHEGGGNARQRRKRLRAALREAVRLRTVEPAP